MIYLAILGIIILTYIIFLFILNYKINKLEWKIIQLFSSRTNTIPWLYEITKNYLVKHNKIFENSINLKKEEFIKIDNNSNFLDILQTEALIHKELNFIFRICKKNHKFIYLREIIINKSFEIGEKISIYKKIIKKYNKLIKIKNFTIIWLLVPIYPKETL